MKEVDQQRFPAEASGSSQPYFPTTAFPFCQFTFWSFCLNFIFIKDLQFLKKFKTAFAMKKLRLKRQSFISPSSATSKLLEHIPSIVQVFMPMMFCSITSQLWKPAQRDGHQRNNYQKQWPTVCSLVPSVSSFHIPWGKSMTKSLAFIFSFKWKLQHPASFIGNRFKNRVSWVLCE